MRTTSYLLLMLPENFIALMRHSSFAKLRVLCVILDEYHAWGEQCSYRTGMQDFKGLRARLPSKTQMVLISPVGGPDARRNAIASFGLDSRIRNLGQASPPPNITYRVYRFDLIDKYVRALLSDAMPLLVYVKSHRMMLEMYRLFQFWVDSGVLIATVLLYSAQMTAAHCVSTLQRFQDPCGGLVVIATGAIGMGVDLDIKSVWHIGVPEELGTLFNRGGRAGRRGGEATVVVFTIPSEAAKASDELKDFVGYIAPIVTPAGAKKKTHGFVCTICGSLRFVGAHCTVPRAILDVWTCANVNLACNQRICLKVVEQRFYLGQSMLKKVQEREGLFGCTCSVCSPFIAAEIEVNDSVMVISRGAYYGDVLRVLKVGKGKAQLMLGTGRKYTFSFESLVPVAPLATGDDQTNRGAGKQASKRVAGRKAAKQSSSRVLQDEATLRADLIAVARQHAYKQRLERVTILPDNVLDTICRTMPRENDCFWAQTFPDLEQRTDFADIVSSRAVEQEALTIEVRKPAVRKKAKSGSSVEYAPLAHDDEMAEQSDIDEQEFIQFVKNNKRNKRK